MRRRPGLTEHARKHIRSRMIGIKLCGSSLRKVDNCAPFVAGAGGCACPRRGDDGPDRQGANLKRPGPPGEGSPSPDRSDGIGCLWLGVRRFMAAAGSFRGPEHDPEKACPALDAGWGPVSRLREARGTVRRFGLRLRRAKPGRKRSCSSKSTSARHGSGPRPCYNVSARRGPASQRGCGGC
jgi:hypothetical protein